MAKVTLILPRLRSIGMSKRANEFLSEVILILPRLCSIVVRKTAHKILSMVTLFAQYATHRCERAR